MAANILKILNVGLACFYLKIALVRNFFQVGEGVWYAGSSSWFAGRQIQLSLFMI